MLGTLSDVNAVLAEHHVTTIFFAIPSIDAGTLRSFINSIDADDVSIDIVPRTYGTLSSENVRIENLTDVDVLDLVGRQPVKHDLLTSKRFVQDKVIVVTGAAGSVGSQLVRQLAALGADRVVGVDWWENGLFFLGEELERFDNVQLEVADIRSAERVDRLLAEHRPDVVFHAAAYKHVPLMQSNPVEAIINNVGGTLNMVRSAVLADVAHFVYVSTDKAVNPVNVMGSTKRLGELIVSHAAAEQRRTHFNTVRFGNVIESNGSVMQIFRRQFANRESLTVTHPDVTRFFMTIDEAAQLIIQSPILGRSGETYVLDMGEPVRIMDLATSLVKVIDPSLTIDVIGLRPGEKMYEELSYNPDLVSATTNPKVFATNDAAGGPGAAEIEALAMECASYRLTADQAVERLRRFGFEIQ